MKLIPTSSLAEEDLLRSLTRTTDTLAFSWNNKDQITQITFDDGTTETSYAITYNGMGKVDSYTKSEDSYEIEEWTFAYGPHGLEYARKFVNDEEVLTQDFTTDPNGIILSMTYNEDDAQEGVNGEYYFHYDNFGNTVLLTDEDGVPQYTALYDISNGKRIQEWNPNDLDFAIKNEGQEEKISFEISDIQLTLHYELTVRKYSAIAINPNKDWIDLTAKNWRGGNTINLCGGECPPNKPIKICDLTLRCTRAEDIYKVILYVDEEQARVRKEYVRTDIYWFDVSIGRGICDYKLHHYKYTLKKIDGYSVNHPEMIGKEFECHLLSCTDCKCVEVGAN